LQPLTKKIISKRPRYQKRLRSRYNKAELIIVSMRAKLLKERKTYFLLESEHELIAQQSVTATNLRSVAINLTELPSYNYS